MRLKFNHDLEEFIRTVDSFISIVLQLAQIGITAYGLHYMMTHSR